MVKGNRHHLQQVINNLIDNSLKFTPAGGKVNITIDVDLLTKSACFSVRDTGVGIASDEKLQLFDRFYRGDHSRRRDTVTCGTGLSSDRTGSLRHAHHRKPSRSRQLLTSYYLSRTDGQNPRREADGMDECRRVLLGGSLLPL